MHGNDGGEKRKCEGRWRGRGVYTVSKNHPNSTSEKS